ncbi:Acyl-CoA transferase/carnitine dehydratase [Cupriavidus necator]|uniref:Acyl-CoA transferase/carnitine dehydratase n=1 Tax=Cupriavidus necator TaxID=106590 RepID=A0A1K0IT36_CUPNE|nr:Acyl-CoA transferase/carnitine dehydratase [Cupriavidus necator]
MHPLKGLTIIDLTSVVAGPFATQLLVQQGARVLKIEPPEGDRARMLGVVGVPQFSSAHAFLNSGKESVGLDLGKEDGVRILKQLTSGADVMVHNFRPGVMDRLGFGVEVLHALNPSLVIARISGFGQDGPCHGERAYDPILQAESGMAIRDDSGVPHLLPQYICDKTAGLYAAQAVSAALVERERSGRGSVVDISMLEAAVAFGWIDVHSRETFQVPAPPSTIGAVYRPWATRDGWLVIVMLSQVEFEGWARAVGAEQLLEDPRFSDMQSRFQNWGALREFGEKKLGELTTSEAAARLRSAGVPCGVARLSSDLHSHEQIAADRFLATHDHGKTGPTTLPLPVARFNSLRQPPALHAPAIGEHTRAVLMQFGFTHRQIDAAFASGTTHSKEA